MDVDHVSFELSPAMTSDLLGGSHVAFNTQINDLLLVALYQSIVDHYGEGVLQIDMEGHGRESIDEELDVSRTVGWFTSIYPVYLEGRSGSLSGLIKSVKEISSPESPRMVLTTYCVATWTPRQVPSLPERADLPRLASII